MGSALRTEWYDAWPGGRHRSGKSTLLQHLNGSICRRWQVQVTVDTTDAQVDLKGLRRFAGLVFQNRSCTFLKQYVGDEMTYGAKLYFVARLA